MGRLQQTFLCLLILALTVGVAQAFNPRALSEHPSTSTVANTTLASTALPTSNVTAVLASFPANLTGDLTGIQLPDATELLLIEQYVLNLTRPSIKSFVDGTSTTIDCVPIQSQLSLASPALQNHTLTTIPPPAPSLNTTLNSALRSDLTTAAPVLNTHAPTVTTPSANASLPYKTGVNSPGGCPSGSVPVPRLTVADIARFGSLQAFLNSTVNKGPPPNASAPSAANTGHEYATLFPASGPSQYYGMQTSLSVWQPFVADPLRSNEFSLSQLWVTGGTGTNLQTIEAGWQVDPVSYGDSNPHFFIFSTRAGYTDPICYAGRKDCPKGAATFVQVSNSVYPTITLPSSVANGIPVQFTLLVSRDSTNGNWWVKLGDEWVGYYPGDLYTSIGQSADSVQVGGEIVDTARLPGSPSGEAHTKTQMGSGQFATQPSPSTVAYHYKMMYVDAKNVLQTLDGIFAINKNPTAYNPACYSGELVPSTDGPQIFFFGGPGYNPQCAS